MSTNTQQEPDLQDLRGFALGDVVDGRYELRRLLGSGAEGIVFEAVHRFTAQRLAIKISSPSRGDTQGRQRRARMLREATVLGRLRHPNIVAVFDARIEGDPSFLVLELLEGRTLESLLAARGTLEPTEAVRAILPACHALSFAHQRKALHRDLKPSNILVAQDAVVGETVKIVDFGASLVEEEPGQAKLTATDAIVGTPSYMAPEQLVGEADLDNRVDVYSIGAVLFECISGRLVRPGNYKQILHSTYTAPPPLLRDHAPSVSPALARVVQRAISTDRNERQASASLLADELRLACPDAIGRTTLLESHAAESRRRFLRANYASPVRVIAADGTTIDGRSQDISESGMLFQGARVGAPGDVVVVRFSLPVEGKVASCRAHVRWVSGAGRPLQVMGLEFADIATNVRASIARYVALMASRSWIGVDRGDDSHETVADSPGGQLAKADIKTIPVRGNR
jgi:serine/threonine protein kinase